MERKDGWKRWQTNERSWKLSMGQGQERKRKDDSVEMSKYERAIAKRIQEEEQIIVRESCSRT